MGPGNRALDGGWVRCTLGGAMRVAAAIQSVAAVTVAAVRCCFRPVGMPHTEQVMVHNLDAHGSLHLLSISGSTSHFHCSFFLEKVSRKFCGH